MNLLVKKLIENEKFNQYLKDIKGEANPISLSGLSDVGKAHIIISTAEKIKNQIIILTYNEIQAKELIKNLQFFAGSNNKISNEIVYIPKKEISPYDYESQSKDLPYERIDALNKIYNGNAKIIILTIESLMQKILPKELLYRNVINFKVGETFKVPNNKEYKKFDMETLKDILIKLGYERNDLVENRGQFSTRGGITDIGLSSKIGVRIEFWGDEVDSIRYFNISSQRSNEMLEEILIYPAHEYIVDEKLREHIVSKIKDEYINDNSKISEEQIKSISADIEQILNTVNISKIDKYFNKFYEKQEYILDYLSNNCVIYFDEVAKINQRRENIVIENNNLIKSLKEKERFVPEAILDISESKISKKDWDKEIIKSKQIIYIQSNDSYISTYKYDFSYREINFFKSEIELLLSDIKKWKKEEKQIILLTGNDGNTEKLENLLKDNELKYKISDGQKLEEKSINIVKNMGMISAGFESYDLKLVLINLSEIFEIPVKKKKSSSTFKEGEKVVFADLKQGDIVVHKLHGIGQYIGVNTITADNITKDYIKIKYRNDDILYVPTNSLDNVRKYIGGGESAEPKLNKLGTKEWSNTKERVKKNLREVAKDLIELYAKRQKMQGFSFSEDTTWQRQFEDSFPYQETDDQLRCIEEVKKDMEEPRPMDRLLCGDVGYGKTEVAIRAAFKAVMDQKQVVYLVPTTVLANQQYEEFKRRMEKFAVKVELLNRFRTKKEQEQVIRKLKLGEVDVVIGTHRVLSNDVEFKNLGLLIIDEEHRFGVKDKEKIKKLKNSVDVLTMTATPIPRTLHMSILGVRDMSVIYDPPQNRRPVQTYVLEHDLEVIKEAITREIERGGQIFYLFNNVEGIEKKSLEISKLVPEAKVEFAHGKMSGNELEEIMNRFISKDIDVLICTTILESGIDIPNANTIIVENADRLGLAQLYQIRGRVGRSDKQAYAYIMYKRDKILTEVADKRLKAIKEFTEFGSGFKIAMRDLEIRGAGSLLGEIQHGHMEQVGYDTYCKLLDEVVKEMQGYDVKEEQDIQIDIGITSYIPDSYIDSSSQKIEVYQNIALCRNEEDIQNVIDEVIDRYGIMPKELENLIEVARIKELCRVSNVIKIVQRMKNILFYFDKNNYNPEIIDKIVKKYEYRVKFSNGIEPYVTIKIEDIKDKNIINDIKEFLKYVKI